jgi:hypothetical protein
MEQQENQAHRSLSDKELQDARQTVKIFLLAWKNYGLYPEDHVNTIKSFENLNAAFSNFFTNHDELRLTVEKDRLLYSSEVVYEVSQETSSEDLTTLLFRDGIKWIAFKDGLTLEEIASFFRIANNYRSFLEEAEGDIVTDLIDEELEYIDFKAVDIFWQDLLLIDFSKLPQQASQDEDDAEKKKADRPREPEGSGKEKINARSIADLLTGDVQLGLSDDENETLRQMVEDEESWIFTEDLFDLLLIILKSQSEPEKYEAVLGFVLEMAVKTIELDKCELAIKLFQSLYNLFTKELDEKDWKRPPIKRFFDDLNDPEILQLIGDKLLNVPTSEVDKFKTLGQALHYFSPRVVPYLVPVIVQTRSPEMQRMVSDVIVKKSRRDIGPLNEIAQKHGQQMGVRLLAILNRLQGDRINTIILRMCDHPSDIVRRNAIKELVKRDPEYAQQLFSRIDDPSKEVRASILAAFAKHRSGALENLLLNYMQENIGKKDPAHILACFEALGRCGSNTSVPFLSKILLNKGWNNFMGTGKPVFRQGAAQALSFIDTPEAKDAVQKASESSFEVVRNALNRIKGISKN